MPAVEAPKAKNTGRSSKYAVCGAEGAHQHHSHNDNCDIAVNNGFQPAAEARIQRAVNALSSADFFFDTLCCNDVGIHAHTDGKDNARNARQREREAGEHRKVTGHKGQCHSRLSQKGNGRHKARQPVIQYHEQGYQHKCNDAGQHHGIQ